MSVGDCKVPLSTPLSEGAPLLKYGARSGSLPSLPELDLPAPNENHPGQGSAVEFSALSLQEHKDALTEKPKQCYPSEGAASRTIPRGRYARSKANWVSKERSTPEGYNRKEHAWRFEYPYLPGTSPTSMARAYMATLKTPVVVHPPKNKKSPEERNAIRERKIMQNERASLRNVQTALRKYNRANNTTFELGEITVVCLFFEFGGPCYHYNFTAKPDNHPSAGGSMNHFFAEINCLQSEDDVLVCCIIGEKDAVIAMLARIIGLRWYTHQVVCTVAVILLLLIILMRTAQAQIVTISAT